MFLFIFLMFLDIFTMYTLQHVLNKVRKLDKWRIRKVVGLKKSFFHFLFTGSSSEIV